MKTSKYFIRVNPADCKKFTDHLSRNHIKNELLSTHIGPINGSMMFSMRLTREEASLIKLSFNLVGMMNFDKTMDNLVEQRTN
jgi:hypothetical protein